MKPPSNKQMKRSFTLPPQEHSNENPENRTRNSPDGRLSPTSFNRTEVSKCENCHRNKASMGFLAKINLSIEKLCVDCGKTKVRGNKDKADEYVYRCYGCNEDFPSFDKARKMTDHQNCSLFKGKSRMRDKRDRTEKDDSLPYPNQKSMIFRPIRAHTGSEQNGEAKTLIVNLNIPLSLSVGREEEERDETKDLTFQFRFWLERRSSDKQIPSALDQIILASSSYDNGTRTLEMVNNIITDNSSANPHQERRIK